MTLVAYVKVVTVVTAVKMTYKILLTLVAQKNYKIKYFFLEKNVLRNNFCRTKHIILERLQDRGDAPGVLLR